MLRKLISKTIARGRLAVVFPGGRRENFGPGGGAEAAISISDTATMIRIAANPSQRSARSARRFMNSGIAVCVG
jgi:hypothetical protein